MRNSIKLMLVGLWTVNMVGCATITTDANQMIQITAQDKSSQDINGAVCELKNKRGQWQLETQGTTEVHKSADNLLVKCSKEGMKDGQGTLISRANAGLWGNILIGGGIGAIIDHNKGTAYNYPSWIKIIMGDNLMFDKSDQEKEQILSGTSLTEDEMKKIEQEKEKLEEEAVAKAKEEQEKG